MTQLQGATDNHLLAAQIGQAWLDAYHADPEEPRRSEHFEHLQDLVDQQMQVAPDARLDDLVEQAYAWIRNSDPNATESAMDFVRALLPHFESLTQMEGESQAAFLLAIPIIGTPQAATEIALNADGMALEEALMESGVLPPTSRTYWLPRPVSVHEAGTWMADTRRLLLAAAFNGETLQDVVLPPAKAFGVDRVSLSLLVGVCVCPEALADKAQEDPAFLYADPTHFFDDLDNPPAESEAWVMARRDEASLLAVEKLGQRLANAGFSGTRLDEPGVLSEALAKVVAWSIATQQSQEAAFLRLTSADRAEFGQQGHHRIGMDISSDTLTFLSEYKGKMLGPFATDLPWRNISVEQVCQALNDMGLIDHPDNVEFFADAASLWEASRPAIPRHRAN